MSHVMFHESGPISFKGGTPFFPSAEAKIYQVITVISNLNSKKNSSYNPRGGRRRRTAILTKYYHGWLYGHSIPKEHPPVLTNSMHAAAPGLRGSPLGGGALWEGPEAAPPPPGIPPPLPTALPSGPSTLPPTACLPPTVAAVAPAAFAFAFALAFAFATFMRFSAAFPGTIPSTIFFTIARGP